MDLADHIPNLLRPVERLLIGGRVDADGLNAARAEGVTQVIDLLPELEHCGFDEAAAAARIGLAYVNLPITGAADLSRENVLAFDRLLAPADPACRLVHCASGNRVGALFALRAGWLQGLPFPRAMQIGRDHGLTKLEPVVAQLLTHGSP